MFLEPAAYLDVLLAQHTPVSLDPILGVYDGGFELSLDSLLLLLLRHDRPAGSS